jgi:cytochrome c oxidase subunit III
LASDAAHALEHPYGLAHQFDDLKQQHEAATLGMWLFLATEIMFFGGLFLGYAVYRWAYHDVFVAGSGEMDVLIGTINTGVLLCSSLTMALAVHAAQTGNRKGTFRFLIGTLVLGAVFLGFKAVEYAHKFEHHLVPGLGFQAPGLHLAGAETAPELVRASEIFFSFYFAMTGMHALHMVLGMGVLSYLAYAAWRGRYSSEYSNPVEMFGLYWHFVDIIWIFLFPLFYLITH